MPDRDVAIDLEAIREDIALAARSSEMARHVALDHGPELIAEVERTRETLNNVMDVAVQRGQELDKHNEYRTSPVGEAG